MYFLGYDLGSSSVKATLIEAESGRLIASASAPEVEMEMISLQTGWAEQNPEIWWQNLKKATHQLLNKAALPAEDIKAIGISYQMHGLVLIDQNLEVLRPSIIWCDSRAVEIGAKALDELGEIYCLKHLLNSPGNFTASKLKWVKDHEPEIYQKIFKILLPGDYLAARMTGEVNTTHTGLSEGIMWDYLEKNVSHRLFDYYGLDTSLIAPIVPVFSEQATLHKSIAEELGLAPKTKICYRAGDQPNNAFSLNVLHPGEIATTAGTSGVIYGVTDQPVADLHSRVNTFIHVNHLENNPSYGILLCINGTGILNSWLRKNFLTQGETMMSYEKMNELAAQTPIGADHLLVLPFGNGAERMLQNQNIGASFHHLDLNRHHQGHLCRAVQEGIVFSMNYGFEILKAMGLNSQVIRAGQANMFLSPLFCEAFVNVAQVNLELYNTDGAQGAARGAGVGLGYYQNPTEAFQSLACLQSYSPDAEKSKRYQETYQQWEKILKQQIS
ncbi:MAG: FGGY family carbohydrate kinase [Microscillaceae bacterium]|nr:FGGY family carbohydrate kinase [Microscillaceae bacterium]